MKQQQNTMKQQQWRQQQQQEQRKQQRNHPGSAANHSNGACVSRPPSATTYASATAVDGGSLGGVLGGRGGRGVFGGLGGGSVLDGLGGGGVLGALGGDGVLGALGGLDRHRAAKLRSSAKGREHENACDAADADVYLGEIGENNLVESIRLTMLSLDLAINAQDTAATKKKTGSESLVHILCERVSMLNSSTTLTRV